MGLCSLHAHRKWNDEAPSVDACGLCLIVLTNLSADTDTVADLDAFNVLANLGSSADDLVTGNAEVMVQRTPTTRDGVDVRAANATVGDGNVDIVVGLLLEFKVIDLEVGPVLGVSNSVSTRHGELVFTLGGEDKEAGDGGGGGGEEDEQAICVYMATEASVVAQSNSHWNGHGNCKF